MTRGARRRIVLLGPSLSAVSGVSTHVNMLLGSTLSQEFELFHFQVGSEGRQEGVIRQVWRLVISPLALIAYLLRNRTDIVHINTSLDQKAYWRDVVYLVIARTIGQKTVCQIHGGALPQNFFPRSRILSQGLRLALRTATAVSVLSKEELRAYRAFDNRLNVFLTPNAIIADDVLAALRKNSQSAALRLVYVGRIVASKGIFEVIEALRLLKLRGHDLTLRIAGSGPDERDLIEAVRRARLVGAIRFLGPVFGSEKTRLWLDSDVFVFPTWHKEGLPYAILESMAAGCVPVTCAVAAIPDVIQNGVEGLFVQPKDPESLANALAELDRDRHVMERMAVAARARIRAQYTSARLTQQFRRLYMSL